MEQAIDDNKILIEDIPKMVDQSSKTKTGHRGFIDPKYLLF
jgi:hypothetical protein